MWIIEQQIRDLMQIKAHILTVVKILLKFKTEYLNNKQTPEENLAESKLD